MADEFVLIHGDNELSLSLTTTALGYVATVEGVATDIEVTPLPNNRWLLRADHKNYVVASAGQSGGKTVVTCGAAEEKVRLVDALRYRLAQAAGLDSAGAESGGTIVAPIAGRVVKLLVGEGDSVTPGQGVVVLEAMKMENEIRAEIAGTVASVLVAAGDSVETEQPMLELNPS